MMWQYKEIGALIKEYGGKVQTGPFGSQLHESDYSSVGVPVVMPKDIIDGIINEDSVAKIDENIYRKVKRHALEIGDIILPRRGNFAKRAIITEREKGWLCGTGCIKIHISEDAIVPRFLYFYLSQEYVVEYIESQAVGSTMLNLSASIVERFKIPVPPLPIQRRIAYTLGQYDTLIENYQGQISALEGMAHELYREWFVRGRCPYAQPAEDGELPIGWERVQFTKHIAVLSGGTPKTDVEAYWDGIIPWLSPADVGASCYVLNTGKTISELGLKNCNSKLYPIDTVVITARGTVGKCIMLGCPMAINQSNYGLAGKNLSQYFVYFKTLDIVALLKKEAIGAVFETITTNNFERAQIDLPPKEITDRFDAAVKPIFQKIRNCMLQLAILRQMRDALLPRLLSGQLDVSAAIS